MKVYRNPESPAKNVVILVVTVTGKGATPKIWYVFNLVNPLGFNIKTQLSKNFPKYPWSIPQTQNQQFMKEFLSSQRKDQQQDA